MNLALGAILLAILLIPPLIFLYSYRSGNHAKAAPKLTILEYLLLSSVLSLFLHGLIIHFFNLRIDYIFLLRLIAGNLTEDYLKTLTDEKLQLYLIGFIKYIVWVCFGCSLAGFILQRVVISRKIRNWNRLQSLRNDRKPTTFSYFNDWWYYFRAYDYSREYGYLRDKEPVIFTDILADTKDGSVLYSGILQDFVTDGVNLDRVYLSGTTKRLFTTKIDAATNVSLMEGEEVEMPQGGYFCIRSNNILNIHIRFAEIIVMTADDDNFQEVTDQTQSSTVIESAEYIEPTENT